MKKLGIFYFVILTLLMNFNSSIATNLTEAEELKESPSPLCDLPNELKEHIFTYLDDTRGFIQLSHANHNLREVAYKAGKDKSIDLSHRMFTAEDYDALIKAPFATITLWPCNSSKNALLLIFQLNTINKRLRANIFTTEKFGIYERKVLLKYRCGPISVKYLFRTGTPRLTSLSLSENYIIQAIGNPTHEAQSSNLNSLNLSSNYRGSK